METLLIIVSLILLAWWLLLPGGLLGYIFLYRISYCVSQGVRSGCGNVEFSEQFGSLRITVKNSEFFISPDKDVHHKLLRILARRLADQHGFLGGHALILDKSTLFTFKTSDGSLIAHRREQK